MSESSLFDGLPIPPRDRLVADTEARRLSRQSAVVLKRLRQGRATNRELIGTSLNYRARISDLRAAGHDVRVVERDHATGRSVYALFVAGREYQP